jgi:group II intron reverse transcriptase/maturase
MALIKQTSHDKVTVLLEEILDRANMFNALNRVEKNKGCPGIDNLSTSELRSYLKENWIQIKESILLGTYKPNPAKYVLIPKADGKKRQLGIPTVLDRLIQQAILQKLAPIFEPSFSKHSFGFMTGKSAHDAIKQAHQFQKEGNIYVVDFDLENFFDRVNHDILMSKISSKINDKRVLKLIRAFLNAGIMHNLEYIPTKVGTPQGSPLSPLLSNIMLDELDKELETRKHKFCRYADDCNIYVKTKRAGERVFASIKCFLEKRLKLSINFEKSAVDFAWKRKFLGYSFLGIKNPIIRISKQSLIKFKDRVRQITKGHRSQPLTERINNLNTFIRGWTNYFQLTKTERLLKDLDSWVRHRLRMCLFKQWRKPRTRVRNMMKLGATFEESKEYRCSKRYWYKSKTKTSNVILNNEFFINKGYQGVHENWIKGRIIT